MEYWDVYNEKKERTGKIVKRGDFLNDDEYHIVVNAWIKNQDGKYLISQRSANKSHPLMWETTGGSILQGETALDGVLREVKEELNIDLNKQDAIYIGSGKRYYKGCPDILEIFLFEINSENLNIKVQEEEVNDYMWASVNEIKHLYESKKFEATLYFDEIIK